MNDRASPISLASSDVDIENVTLSTNVTYAVDSSYHIEDDSVVISRDDESDDESCILGSESSEDEEQQHKNEKESQSIFLSFTRFPSFYCRTDSMFCPFTWLGGGRRV